MDFLRHFYQAKRSINLRGKEICPASSTIFNILKKMLESKELSI